MEKFKKPRLLTPRDQSHKKFWQAAGLCALTAAVFFLPFYLLDGGFFHYAGDFNSQQISFYRYMNGFVKGAGYPDSTFAGAPHNTFSWATDLGSGVMNAYSFYLYGSPFFWLSVLLPQSWLPYMMVPLLVLKFGVAGGGAFLCTMYSLTTLWMWWRCSPTCFGRWTRPFMKTVTASSPSGWR